MNPQRYIELMTYELKEEQTDSFHYAEVNLSLPLHTRFGINVVSFGPSSHKANQYLLIRTFSSEAEYEEQLERFYASKDWQNIREEIVSRIISTHKITFWLDEADVEILKKIKLN